VKTRKKKEGTKRRSRLNAIDDEGTKSKKGWEDGEGPSKESPPGAASRKHDVEANPR